jgi:23S rRNA (uracil1939-C5)-methyltransferase
MSDTLRGALEALRGHLVPGLKGAGTVDMLSDSHGAVVVSVNGPAVAEAVAALVGVGGIVGANHGSATWGQQTLLIDEKFHCGAGDFVQASEEGNRALVELVASAVAGFDGDAVEFFAGKGNLTRLLIGSARRIVAIDLRTGDLSGVEWRTGDAVAEADALVAAGQTFGLALLDPPRTGAKELVSRLSALGVDTVVYVSCDPATLARDVSLLVDHGYRPQWARGIDMMPQTSHVEVVAVLTRS